MTVAHLVQENPGDLPEQDTKWATYIDLVTVLNEMSMQKMMFTLQYHSPNEELLTEPIKDMILAGRPAGMFRSVATL